MENALLKIDLKDKHPMKRMMMRPVVPILERLLALDEINKKYREVVTMQDNLLFAEKALKVLNIQWETPAECLARIPRTGPLVLVSNHPFGAAEWLVLSALLKNIRTDVKFLANYLLGMIPDIRDSLLLVDPFNNKNSIRRNLNSVKSAMKWVREGNALAVFPAGEVSHLDIRSRSIIDSEWNTAAARICLKTEATAMPMYFHGGNSSAFQIMGLIHPVLRTGMLPRELLKKRNNIIELSFSSPVSPERIRQFTSAETLTSYLRTRTYLLKSKYHGSRSRLAVGQSLPSKAEIPVTSPVSREAVYEEYTSIPANQMLPGTRQFQVFHFSAGQCPGLLHEIGRLREVTFRAVGEGTGREIDLDRFDDYYQHIVVWDKDKRRIAGAYRIGKVDEILASQGKKGLYTSTLFKYRTKLLYEISPALELGRSFVCLEYQKSYSPLLLLWKGIAGYVARNPKYKVLFGPVSISNNYHSVCRQLMVQFLEQNHLFETYARQVRPLNEPKRLKVNGWPGGSGGNCSRSMEELEELIREADPKMKAAPVLLRQYLKLNAKVIGFNVDPEFNDALDALMIVDLTQMDESILQKYMGKDQTAEYLSFHSIAA